MTVHITPGLDMRYMGLPKWPQMIVRGQPVTVGQAKEIIRRTDYAFTGVLSGNDHATIRIIATKLGLPSAMYHHPSNRDDKFDWEAAADFRELWGTIPTDYVTNNWVSSAFVYGPHGWCHPDGTISYDDNVGKWPNLDDIIKDWDTLAAAFPFLDLTVTLMNGESCEDDTRPVVTLKVRNGNVTVCPPEPAVDTTYPARDLADAIQKLATSGVEGRECGIPMAWIDEWGAQHWDKVRAQQTTPHKGGLT